MVTLRILDFALAAATDAFNLSLAMTDVLAAVVSLISLESLSLLPSLSMNGLMLLAVEPAIGPAELMALAFAFACCVVRLCCVIGLYVCVVCLCCVFVLSLQCKLFVLQTEY